MSIDSGRQNDGVGKDEFVFAPQEKLSAGLRQNGYTSHGQNIVGNCVGPAEAVHDQHDGGVQIDDVLALVLSTMAAQETRTDLIRSHT